MRVLGLGLVGLWRLVSTDFGEQPAVVLFRLRRSWEPAEHHRRADLFYFIGFQDNDVPSGAVNIVQPVLTWGTALCPASLRL